MNAALSTGAINSVTSPRNLAASLAEFPPLSHGTVSVEAAASSPSPYYGPPPAPSQSPYLEGGNMGSGGGDDGKLRGVVLRENEHSQKFNYSTSSPRQDYQQQHYEKAVSNASSSISSTTSKSKYRRGTAETSIEATTSNNTSHQQEMQPLSQHHQRSRRSTHEMVEAGRQTNETGRGTSGGQDPDDDPDDPLKLKRKRVSEMTSDERVQCKIFIFVHELNLCVSFSSSLALFFLLSFDV